MLNVHLLFKIVKNMKKPCKWNYNGAHTVTGIWVVDKYLMVIKKK
jgi:hypothetical protein